MSLSPEKLGKLTFMILALLGLIWWKLRKKKKVKSEDSLVQKDY